MRERPIIFSVPMVRAILAGTKTQTRRVVKPQPSGGVSSVYLPFADDPNNWQGYSDLDGRIHWYGRCPYGQPGTTLWVREAWRVVWSSDNEPPRELDAAYRFWYEADAPLQDGYGKLRPSIHMPRFASRITLEITSVRVERLQDISEADAAAEGVTPKWEPGFSGRLMEALGGFSFRPAASAYADFCESLHGPGSWDANPWVWVVEFKRINQTGNT